MPRALRCCRILFAALFLGNAAGWTPAAAQWSVGDWNGASYVDRAGAFSHCIMSAKYNSGITLYFLLFRNHDLFIGVSAPDWSLSPHSPYTMTMVIDGKTIRSAPGTVLRYDTKRLWLDLGKDRKIRELLRRGLKLRLTQGERDYGFRLTGTAVALKRLEKCVQGAATQSRRNSRRKRRLRPSRNRGCEPGIGPADRHTRQPALTMGRRRG